MKVDRSLRGAALAIHFSLAKYLEIIFTTLGTIGLFISLAAFARGGLLGTDILAYINVSLNGIKSTANVYDRYFYLLIQSIFVKNAPTPLVGAQWYWAFLMTATCLLIYVCARLFSPNSGPLHGLLAVATFLSIGDIAGTNGTPGVDLAAMVMVILLVLIYLLSARRQHHSWVLVALFGFFLYLAFRTKETCLAASILVFGFGFTEKDQFNWSAFGKNLLVLLGGFLAGLVFFAVCMWIFVGDPLFGLRFSEFRDYLASYAGDQIGGQAQNGLANWLTDYFFAGLLIPFMLYILSGLKTSPLTLTRRWVWILPLASIIFVSATVGNRWGIQGRYVYTALPVVCLLWPQSLNFHFSRDPRKRNVATLFILGGMAAIVGIRLLMRLALPKLGWDTVTFLNVVFYPLLLACILLVYFFSARPGVMTSILISLLVTAAFVSPFVSNFQVVFISNRIKDSADIVFHPFSSFSKQIVFTPSMRMYISTDTWNALGYSFYPKNTDKVISIFNDYFDASSTRDNFTYASFNNNDPPAILSGKFSYLLLTRANWRLLAKDPSAVSLIQQNYQVFYDPRMILVLLKAR
jgi:hypothetical protein